MTIRIHEADGTPYEHVLDIRSPFKRYEVPFNTKYKRVRRNTKRYLARQAAAQAAAEGDADAAAAMDMVDMGFGLEIWENEQERENWKVADWTEEDEQNMAGQTYEWIRIDADFEWIAAIAFDQKDYMWVSQLQRDRDVVAQYEVGMTATLLSIVLTSVQAIAVLSKSPNAIISSTLTKTVLVSNYFYRIRCEAAGALVNVRHTFSIPYHLANSTVRSVRPKNSTGLVSSTSSSCSSDTATSLKIQRRISSAIRMSRGPTTSVTLPSTSFGR